MTPHTIRHGTIVVERTYDAEVGRVFDALADIEQRRKWDVPSEGWVITRQDQDFRVGGAESSAFGPVGGPTYESEGTYLQIVPDAVVVSAGTMRNGDAISAATLCTYEFQALDNRTRVIVTDQSTYFDDLETEADRRDGWTCILRSLEQYLESADAPA